MATKSSTQNGKNGSAQASIERIRELNERIVENARKAGNTYLDAYERALTSIAGYQESVANATPIDWLQSVIEAQANFTRELGGFYASTAREALKKK